MTFDNLSPQSTHDLDAEQPRPLSRPRADLKIAKYQKNTTREPNVILLVHSNVDSLNLY